MQKVLEIIKDTTLSYEQRVKTLAAFAEGTVNPLNISEEVQQYRESGIICDLNEGNAPYRPRYIVPDYERFMKNGCLFLKLEPPKDIWEATHNLLIFYKHVPSITTFPVYVGNIDTLLEPFIEDEDVAYRAIKLFFKHIDRTLTDSFCHGNIGPANTKAAKLILKAQRELETASPNLTIKYSSETSDNLAIDAIQTALVTAKPSFANHDMFTRDLGNYGIASCYNGLKVGGGSYTLVRMNLGRLTKKIKDRNHFLNHLLIDVIQKVSEYLDERIRFLVEESGFFENHFLVKEGFIHKKNFSAMFGMVGLAECVNHIFAQEGKPDRFGHSDLADQLGYQIVEILHREVQKHKNPHLEGSDSSFLLHAQVGIDSDIGISPGCRIPIGEEPPIHDHLIQTSMFHKFFPSGIGDIFKFDETYKNNPQAILDMIKGAFSSGMRYFSLYGTDADVIRITGYLVKRSDMEQLDEGKAVLHDTVVLGLNSAKHNHILERKLRTNEDITS